MRLSVLICAITIAVVSFPIVLKATPEDCQYAVDQYNSAIGDVSDNLQRYSSCVEGSNGQDDCSSEFSSLSSSQDDFESAVSNYESECA